MTTSYIDTDDMIDVRDVIARVEALEPLRTPGPVELDVHPDEQDNAQDDFFAELNELEALLSDLCSSGGDEQWHGDWYPVTLIRDSYFETYARDLAEDCGMIPDDATWPCTCIDWEKAARELRMDYSSTEFRGVTYWYR